MSDDFLAREASILGSNFSTNNQGGGTVDVDFDRAASAFPELDFDDAAFVSQPPAAGDTTSGGLLDGFGDFEDHPSAGGHNVKVTGGDDEVDRFESEFPDLGQDEYTQPESSYQPSFIAQPQSRPSFQPPVYQPQEEEEPEVIREWRQKQEEAIRARDEASAAKRQDTIFKAERAIDDFYVDYGKKNERTIKENKESEAEFLATLESSLSNGTTWDRIATLVELENSQSKTIARSGAGTTDLTRFKETLLRLKREGESAPGAAGY